MLWHLLIVMEIACVVFLLDLHVVINQLSVLWTIDKSLFFLSAIVCSWLDFGLSPRCPQVEWCH